MGVLLEHAYHPGRTGRNHLRILADGSGIPLRRVDQMLDLVGLGDAADRHAGTYSLGMLAGALELAAALLGNPPVLVLDEPGNGLDPPGIRDLRDLLRARAAAGGTVACPATCWPRSSTSPTRSWCSNRGRLVTTGNLSDLQQAGISVQTPAVERLAIVLTGAGGTAHRVSDREAPGPRSADRPDRRPERATQASPCTDWRPESAPSRTCSWNGPEMSNDATRH